MRLKRNGAAWAGLLLGLLAVIGYAVWIVPVLSPYAPGLLREWALPTLALLGIGLGLSVVGIRQARGRAPTHRGRFTAPILGGLNLLLAGLFGWVMFGLATDLPASPDAPAVGAAAPGFALGDQHGQRLALADLRGRNVLLIFYRGHW